MAGRIVVDPQDLRRAASVLEREAAAAGEAAAAVASALDRGGLPSYVGQAIAGARDAGRTALRLEALAPALRVRAVFAQHAGASSAFGVQLAVLEYGNPAGFVSMLQKTAYDMLVGELADQGVDLVIGERGPLSLVWTPLTPDERRKMTKDLQLDAQKYLKRFKKSKTWDRLGLALDTRVVAPAVAAARWTRAAKAGKAGLVGEIPVGALGIGVVFDAGFQYWDDRNQTLSGGRRAGRIAVSVGSGAAATAAVAVVCSTGVGCVVLGLGAGFAAAVGSDAVNEALLPSKEEKAAERAAEQAEREWRRQVAALNRLEAWRTKYGEPTRSDLERNLSGMEKRLLSQVPRPPGERGGAVSHYEYLRPDGSVYADRFLEADGDVVSERYFGPDGRVVATYLAGGRRG